MTSSNVLESAANRLQVMTCPVEQDLAWRVAAGLPKPVTVLDALSVLDEEPAPAEVASMMVADLESLSPEWIERHLHLYGRAVQVQAFRSSVEQAGRSVALQRRGEGLSERFGLVAGPVSDALTRLTTLLKSLPDGEAALRPEASIDAHTTNELAEARDLLVRIGTMIGSLQVELSGRLMHKWALALIDIPEVEAAEVQRIGTPVLNPSTKRDAVTEVAQCRDLDQLVIAVLRNTWPCLSLRLVESRAEYQSRAQRVHEAHLVKAANR